MLVFKIWWSGDVTGKLLRMVDACEFAPSAVLQSKERSLSRRGVDAGPD